MGGFSRGYGMRYHGVCTVMIDDDDCIEFMWLILINS